eukprot:6207412-Pleurochrysis_carterae.AAC.2
MAGELIIGPSACGEGGAPSCGRGAVESAAPQDASCGVVGRALPRSKTCEACAGRRTLCRSSS